MDRGGLSPAYGLLVLERSFCICWKQLPNSEDREKELKIYHFPSWRKVKVNDAKYMFQNKGKDLGRAGDDVG